METLYRLSLVRRRVQELLICSWKQCADEGLLNLLTKSVRNSQFNNLKCIHSTSYSIIGYQSAYLATHWNPIYWDTACLIVDSDSISAFDTYQETSEDGSDEEEVNDDKKKNRAINYGKLAVALNKIKSAGIKVIPPNINIAEGGFTPDPDNEQIVYALKGLRGVGDGEITEIINNRPYENFADFCNRVRIKKPAIIALIKAGAFDSLENVSRIDLMKEYIKNIADLKTTLNMRNFSGLIERNLVPQELDLQRRTFNFFKYIKLKQFKVGEDKYLLDDRAKAFLSENYQGYEDYTIIQDNNIILDTKTWKRKVYDKAMLPAKDYISKNLAELLSKFNEYQFNVTWNKYCIGNISKWEMDSMGIYFHEHELSIVNSDKYQLSNYADLPEDPIIDRVYNIKGREIPIFKINKIIGTVISKNNIAKSFTILTPDGSVVNVKLSDEHYAFFNKQISEVVNGVKKVREKSWFNTGNKVMIIGFRRADSFVPKRYKDTIEQHRIYLITDVEENGDIKYTSTRYGQGGEA